MAEDEFIDFGNGLSSRVKGSGWSFQEDGFTWTAGLEATLVLPARPDGEPGRLMLAVRPFAFPARPVQRVNVSVAGQRLSDLTASGDCVLEIEVPADLAGGGDTVTVTLDLPDALSPTQAGLGNDDRRLALAVKWVRWSGPAGQSGGDGGSKTVLLVRSHQVSALTAIFNRVEPLQGKLSLLACAPLVEEVRHAVLGVPRERLAAIWLQRTPGGLSPEDLAAVAGDIPIVSFPHLSMELLWPFAGHDARLEAEPPLYPRGRYPYPDALGAQVALEQVEADETALARYMALSAEALPDFPAALGAYASELRARDRECTIPLAGFILSRFQHARLFHSPLAPTGLLMTHLAVQLALGGGAVPEELLGETLLGLERLMAGYQGLWYEQVPIHPMIAAGYRLRWHDRAARYRWHENEWSFENYILNYIRWAPWAV